MLLQDEGQVALDGAEFVVDNTMWFASARPGFSGMNWFTAENAGGKWANWSPVNFNPEYEVTTYHPGWQRTLFPLSRVGGKGQYDIWVSQNANGQWMPPENVAAVNSAGADGWPFITRDGNELWFLRNYRGTPAVFRSVKISGKWSQPVMIVSQFAGEPSLDNAGNIYFAHHFFKDSRMIEADIYVAFRK